MPTKIKITIEMGDLTADVPEVVEVEATYTTDPRRPVLIEANKDGEKEEIMPGESVGGFVDRVIKDEVRGYF